MNADDVLQAIHNVGGPFAAAQPGQTLGELGADSLDRVELAMALEGQADIVLDDATVEGWGATETTVGQVIELVLMKLAAGEAKVAGRKH